MPSVDCSGGQDRDTTTSETHPYIPPQKTKNCYLTDQFDRAKAKANAEDALSRYPDLSCMVGLFAYNPPKCLEAIKAAGKLGQIKLISFDEEAEALAAIRDGHIHGTVVQNPYMYGYSSVETLHKINGGDTSMIPANKFKGIPARMIRKDNVMEFWADLNKKLDLPAPSAQAAE